jgi:hypothetical protein
VPVQPPNYGLGYAHLLIAQAGHDRTQSGSGLLCFQLESSLFYGCLFA